MADPFLSQYITSLGKHQQVQVSSILNDAILSKTDLNLIVQKLTNFSQFIPVSLSLETQEGPIASSPFQINLRDSTKAIQDVYTYSNYISALLYNLGVLLTEDVVSLEGQLKSLEKTLNNFSFLTADNNAYSYGYLEDFANNNNRDSFPWLIPDRASQVFQSTDQAIVNSAENSLALAQNLQTTYSMIPSIMAGNATAYVVSDTGVKNSVTSISSTGWRISFASPQPITSTLPGATSAGAQVLVEFLLDQPSMASEIEIIPFSDTSMEISQVWVYPSNDDSNFFQLLMTPLEVSQPVTLHMQLQTVQKFRLLLNQTTYNRVADVVNRSEASYAQLTTQPIPPTRKWNFKQFFSYTHKVTGNFSGGGLSRPTSYSLQRGSTLWEVLRDNQQRLGSYQAWTSPAISTSALTNLFLQNPGYYKKIFKTGIASYNFIASNQEQITPQPGDPSPVTAMNTPSAVVDNGFNYQYDLGLQYVAIGSNPVGSKGVFVSTQLPAPGYVGACRLKVVETNYRASNSDRDSDLLTSTEYSVSNVSNPMNESDWTPIIPVSDSPDFIEAERFFPNFAGNGVFRFAADRLRPINIYKNGYNFPIDSSNYILDPSGNVVVGLSIPVGEYTSDDIFVVRYFTVEDNSVITFGNLNNVPLASSHDNSGAGEGFNSLTGGRNSINLSYEPYINYSQVATSTYSDSFGMTPYQPITIRLTDGTVPINLTNYESGPQASLANFTTGYYYIQSNNQIMFNQPISQAFKVFYQYLQGSLRVRVVLRVNDDTFVSPVVNSFNLKGKIIRPNAGS